jgi:hypothetical protein
VGGVVALDDVAEGAVDSGGDVARDSHMVQQARQVAVVVGGVVLGDAVVEEDEVARRPGRILNRST